MKTKREQLASGRAPSRLPGRDHSGAAKAGELAELRVRLAEAKETLRAIRTGEVDAVVTAGKEGLRVFTLEGAGHAYRLLIESMNEGALTLTTDKLIVYANQCFAKMVRCPLGQVMGSSFRRFLSAEDRATLRSLFKRAGHSGSKIQVQLHASDGSQMAVQISIRRTAKDGINRATIGMVVTDLTEARRTEELLRALTHRVVQVQVDERGRVALELHDDITQLLCAILFRSQVLADTLSVRDGPSKREAMQLRELAGKAAEEVERISRNLRPSVLGQLGLVAVMHATSTEFADRTGVSVKQACVELTARLPADIELALYRILQEALRNVQKHARARHVTVQLATQDDLVLLTIKDDGIGFDSDHFSARRKRRGGLGLLGMRERATCVGGTLTIKSGRRAGTEIEVRIPLAPRATAVGRSR
ncbi:MAG: ATP-binding protein [Opitutaceae bacterium]|nr:ATP-binding protein [Opitutaceae bacterium]